MVSFLYNFYFRMFFNIERKFNLDLLFLDYLTKDYEDEVKEILFNSDKEFYPPLSFRKGTTQSNLNLEDGESKVPLDYFIKMKEQSFILAIEDGKVIGFLTFRPSYNLDLENFKCICSYVSTIIVVPEQRNKGITSKMYDKLFKISKDDFVATRTWSTNNSHMHLLDKKGFDLVSRLINDRGNNIDTVYCAKKLRD